jgi:hypothetical protein
VVLPGHFDPGCRVRRQHHVERQAFGVDLGGDAGEHAPCGGGIEAGGDIEERILRLERCHELLEILAWRGTGHCQRAFLACRLDHGGIRGACQCRREYEDAEQQDESDHASSIVVPVSVLRNSIICR